MELLRRKQSRQMIQRMALLIVKLYHVNNHKVYLTIVASKISLRLRSRRVLGPTKKCFCSLKFSRGQKI